MRLVVQVEDILASNFKEGLRKSLEKASSELSLALPSISSLGAPVLRKEEASRPTLYIPHCNLSQANKDVKVREPCLAGACQLDHPPLSSCMDSRAIYRS